MRVELLWQLYDGILINDIRYQYLYIEGMNCITIIHSYQEHIHVGILMYLFFNSLDMKIKLLNIK